MIARSSLPKVQARRRSSKNAGQRLGCWGKSLLESFSRSSPTRRPEFAWAVAGHERPSLGGDHDQRRPPTAAHYTRWLFAPLPPLRPVASSQRKLFLSPKCGERWFPVAACCAACERSSRRLSSDAERPSGEGRAGVVGRRDGYISADGGDDSAVSPKVQPPGPWCQMIGHWGQRETEIPGLH